MTEPLVDETVHLAFNTVEAEADRGLHDLVAHQFVLNLLFEDGDALVDFMEIGARVGQAREIEREANRHPGDDVTDFENGF